VRPSVHGDVVHSRPVAINYGTAALPSIVVYYGANDGMLRAVNGNRSGSLTSNGSTYVAGRELWSFVAPESYALFKRNYENSPQVKVAGITGGTPKPYGMDGPITAYKDASNTWLYASMRRGGRVIYAFDVNTPANPSLKWKVGCPNNFPASGTVDDTGCTSGFTGIGQTWSAPKTLVASGYSSGSKPMIIMGGGYDPCEDSDPNSCTTSSKGNHIYVLDADKGTLLKAFDTDRSVVGDVTVVPDTTTGMAIYAYAADMGGNVYRITMGSAAPADWTMTKLASLGCATATSCASNRKFMFAPDVSLDNGTYILVLGSGDREKPLSTYTNAYGVQNYFFMIKDKPSDSTWLSAESANCGNSSVICLNSLLGITTSSTPSQTSLDAKKGWYLGLAAHEQVVTSAITLYGAVTFSTHQPVSTVASCGSTLGTSQVYNINYTNAASALGGNNRYQQISGGGLPPSPVAGMVTLDDGKTVPFIIGANPNSPLEASVGKPSSSILGTQPKSRVYSYIQK
jgi:type IV pilus assembly protein PilY1